MRACILGACGVVLVFAGLATNRLGAEEERGSRDQTQRYLERYSQFLSLLQETRFKYVGTRTRSTPKEGVAGRWEDSGTMSVSAAQRSYHLTSVGKCVHPRHEDLGGTEDLATPKRYLEVSIPTEDRVAKRKWQYGVSTLPQVRGDEWTKLADDHPLGVLLGYARLDGEEQSLLASCELAAREWLPEEVVESKHLVGFVAKSETVEVRALFDPANQDNLAELRISLSDKSTPKAGAMTSVSLSILDTELTGGRPSSIQVKIVWQLAGGLLDLTQSGEVVAKPSHAQVEPQTWEFTYQVDQFNYAPQADWFTLENAIPNGTPVTVEGLPGLPLSVVITRGTIGGTEYTSHRTPDFELYWKDGRLTPFPLK